MRTRRALFPIVWLFLASAAFALASTSSASGSQRIDLNGEWRLRIDPEGTGEKSEWYKAPPGGTEGVRVPHTWNIGEYEDHEGLANLA